VELKKKRVFFVCLRNLNVTKLFGQEHSSEYLLLCSTEERNTYRFGTTWGWINYDRIVIFEWTIALNIFLYEELLDTTALFCPQERLVSLCSGKTQHFNQKWRIFIILYITIIRSLDLGFYVCAEEDVCCQLNATIPGLAVFSVNR